MLIDADMFPPQAIYEYDYSSENPEKFISPRVLEPGVGSGNFSATILFHKVKFVEQLMSHPKTGADISLYVKWLATATGSVYAFDIDPGNLETVKRRLLGGSRSPIDTTEAIDFWVDRLTISLSEPPEESELRKFVENSLKEAQSHWFEKLEQNNFSGVLDTAFKKQTGKDMPTDVAMFLQSILDENILLFNGISESDDGCVPGWENVRWKWWEFSENAGTDAPRASFSEVSVADQIGAAQAKARSVELNKEYGIGKSLFD